MRSLLLLLVAAALAACSTLGGRQTIESSVILGANGKATTTMKGYPSLDVELRGVGPGEVTFDVRTAGGTPVSHGVLTTESGAQSLTAEGEVVITFAADAKGGTVAYVIRTKNGAAVTTIPQ